MMTKDIGLPYVFEPVLGGVTLPMPTTESLSPYTIGNMIETPDGHVRTQRQFTGEVVSMTWDMLDDDDRILLKNTINNVGFHPTTLMLTDGGTSLLVIPESFTAYSEDKIEHYVAQKIRWNVSMTWKEVP